MIGVGPEAQSGLLDLFYKAESDLELKESVNAQR